MSEAKTATGVTVTFALVYQGKLLFVQRHQDDAILGGYWCFPGGRVHVGETIAGALQRECLEETGLSPTGRAFFVDSFLLGERVGLHFALEVDSDAVVLQPDELANYKWISDETELDQFTPRIPGINNHVHYINKRLAMLQQCCDGAAPAVTKCLEALCWQSLEDYNLVPDRYINK